MFNDIIIHVRVVKSMELRETATSRAFYFESSENASETKINVHYHDWFEIYYLTSGSCNYFIDDKSYKLQAGDIVFIPQGVIHKTNYISSTHSRMLINCSHELIPNCVYKRVTEQINIYRSAEMRKEVDAIFRKIKQEYTEEDAFSDEALRAWLTHLFITVVRAAEKCTNIGAEITSAQKAIEYVQSNYMNRITLSDAARHCSVSSEHLSRTFKKQTGVGFNEYLCLFRLNKAEALLVNQPGVTISDIAYRCGFNDSNYFSNVFRRQYGMSPSQKKKESANT